MVACEITRVRIKNGESNFGEFMVIRQIRQSFPPPMFPSVCYSRSQNLIVSYVAMYEDLGMNDTVNDKNF